MRKKISCFLAVGLLLAGAMLFVPPLFAASPASGTISPATPKVTWTGGPFFASNPVTCFSVGGIDPTCDRFQFTLVPPNQDFVVTVRIIPDSVNNDFDLFVRNPNNQTIATSANETGVEEVTLVNPPAGTYTVVVQPFLVVPGATYDGVAGIGDPAHNEFSNSYNGARLTPDFVGVPNSTPARTSPLVPQLKVSFNYVGRQAGEPTIGINARNAAFFAAATFDFPTPGSPARLARTVVMRSRDKGVTWQPVAGFALSEESLDEPPFTLDPYLHVDPDAGLTDPAGRKLGRVFSVDLLFACGANTVFSDDEGETWTTIPAFACDTPVNDHHTIITAPRPPNRPDLEPVGYPNLLYFCFNRVSDSSCNRSRNGGFNFEPVGTAFTGVDPNASPDGICGGLHGHLAADSTGRIFLPKGHCELPWVANSENAGETFARVTISQHVPIEDHEVSLAVDTADNIYAVWADRTFRLPILSVSSDHGQTWSTPIAFAPPGVHEVNFPTVVAGDPGRIAVLFPGSESTNFRDPTRPWNIYIVVSVNALDDNPTFTWTTANHPSDPVHRGNCGPGRCDAQDGGSMLDFLDIQVSPADGAFWGTASDTCVDACVTDPTAPKLRPGQGVAIRQTKGPSLLTPR